MNWLSGKRGPEKAGIEDNPLNKIQKVSSGVTDPKTGVSLKTKPGHTTFYSDKPMINQEIMTPAPPTSALSQTSYFSFILENKTGGVIKDWTLRFNIQFERKNGQPYGKGCNNAVQPVTQWFERIEWIDRMTGEEIARYHGDMLHMLFSTQSQEDLKAVDDMVNICRETGRYTERQFRHNEIQYFYLPLIDHWFQDMNLDLGALKGDIEIRFYPRGSIFVEDQDALPFAGAFKENLLELRMIQGTCMYPNGMRVDLRRQKLTGGQRNNYLDYQQYIDYGRYFVPGQEYTIDLDQFHNDCAAIVMLMRKAGVQKDAAGQITGEVIDPYKGPQLYKFESLGEQGTIDHENVHGRSLFGDGTPVDELFFRRRYPTELFNNDFAKRNSIYIVPFSNNLQGMLNGEIDGFHRFRGERERLRIRTGAAPSDSIVTMYLENEQDGGFVTGPNAGDSKNCIEVRYKGVQVGYLTDNAINIDAGTGNVVGLQDRSIPLNVLRNKLNSTTYLQTENVQVSKIRARIKDSVTLAIRYISSDDANGGILTDRTAAPDPLALTPGSNEFIQSVELYVTDLDGQPEIQHGADLPKLFTVRYTKRDAGAPAVEYISDSSLSEQIYTPGKRGFNAGVYDVTLYAIYYRTITEVAGTLRASDVVN